MFFFFFQRSDVCLDVCNVMAEWSVSMAAHRHGLLILHPPTKLSSPAIINSGHRQGNKLFVLRGHQFSGLSFPVSSLFLQVDYLVFHYLVIFESECLVTEHAPVLFCANINLSINGLFFNTHKDACIRI